MTDLSIVNQFNDYYEEAYYAWNVYYPLADWDLRNYLGDQWNEKEKSELYSQGRNALVFNRIKRNIDMLTGYQCKNRLSSIVSPVENSSQLTADQLSDVLLNVLTTQNGYQIISDCFAGAMKTGWNLASIWMDYRDDPVNGDIRFSRESYNSFITDPYFTQLDFSDCNYLMRRKYLSLDQAISLIPERAEELRRLHHNGNARDDKFTWLPYQTQPNGQDLLAYNEFYQQKWRDVPMLVDMETGEYTEFDVDPQRMNNFMKMYPQLKKVKKPKRYIERHVIVNNELMFSEENPYGLDEYPFVPFVAVFEPESAEWGLKIQSLIRCMIDPQREINRRRSQMIDILDSQINSGWIADQNSVINPRSLFQSSQGRVIWRDTDAKPGALEKIPPANVPESMFRLADVFDKDIVEIGGMNDAAFGISENANDSGVMMMLRQGASVTTHQNIMDNLRTSQKNLSKKVLKLIQTWTPQKIQKIINKQPTAEFYSQEFLKYDVVVQEGMLTDTQRQMYFRQLVDLKQLGAPISGEMLVKNAPLQGGAELKEQIQQAEQAQAQAAQQQAELQGQVMQSKMQESQAKAISDISLSKERFTRAVANMGLEDERASKAVQDRADSALARAKAIKELDGLDAETIEKYLKLIALMEQSNKVQERSEKEDDIEVSAQGEQAPQESIPPEAQALMEQLNQQTAEVPNERI